MGLATTSNTSFICVLHLPFALPMVYGGKPSRGCRTCRARRIKCDEGKPTCQRCAKSKRECGGYRPEFDIVHRDQTSSTVQKATRIKTTPRPQKVLAVPLAQRATCYFASNFILVPLNINAHGYMDYLVPLIGAAPQGSALRYAFNACAFALLSNCAKADAVNLSQLSLREHTIALAQTYTALGHPATATTDATLATVLLLSLYETITARKETRMLAWRSHIDGAVRIVQTRGRADMCKTRTGALLFAAVRRQLISRTLSSGIPLPLGTDWWMCDEYSDTLLAAAQRYALRCGELRADSTKLLAALSGERPLGSESIKKLRKEAQRVRDCDSSIASWLATIPEELRFVPFCWVSEKDILAGLLSKKVKGNDDGDINLNRYYAQGDVFPGRVDVYPDFVTASAWNLARVTRLLLAATHIRLVAWMCTEAADYRDAPEYAVSRRICEDAISDILASVPYHFGWHHANRGGPRGCGHKGGGRVCSNISSGFVCGTQTSDEASSQGRTSPSIKALPAFLLMWSLTCVKNHDVATPEQRTWAKGRLRVISEEVGLKYARVLNDVDLGIPSMMIQGDFYQAQVQKGGTAVFVNPDPFYRQPLPSRPAPPQSLRTPESMPDVERSPSPL
ncbi:putative transcriptional regulatory protein [Cladorrhinum sp. PSN259]|nr:putative transcriptional regulatory protein [Cladorrhinum sp. PSN259]